MGQSSPKGKVDGKFEARTQDLESSAQQISQAFKDVSQPRPWHTPKELKERELLDVPGLHEPVWNRNDINKIYSEEVLGGSKDKSGTVGDLIAMKWQADFMAAEERAFRMRHASFVRCACLMHGRLDGHGKPEKGIFSYLKKAVQSYIDTGRANGG
jgi:hypothetical protein